MKDNPKTKSISPVVIPFVAVTAFLLFLSIWYGGQIIPKYELLKEADSMAENACYYNAVENYSRLYDSGFTSLGILDKRIKACYRASDFSGAVSALSLRYSADYSGFAKKSEENQKILEDIVLYAVTSETVEKLVSGFDESMAYSDCVSAIEQYLGNGYDDSVIYYYLATTAESFEEGEDCTKYIKKAYEEDCDSALFAFMLGTKYISVNNYSSAIELFEDYIKRNKEPEIVHQLAVAYLLNGDIENAVVNAELAQKLSPGDHKLFTLCISYGLAGDTQKFEELKAMLESSSGSSASKLAEQIRNGTISVEDYYLAKEPESEADE